MSKVLLLVGAWLLVFATVVGQALVILAFHLPPLTAITVYLGILFLDIMVILVAHLLWERRR